MRLPLRNNSFHDFKCALHALLVLLGFVLFVWVSPSSALAAELPKVLLELRNGDKLSGTLLNEDPQRILIRHEILGDIHVPKDHVISRSVIPELGARPAVAAATNATPKSATSTTPPSSGAGAEPTPGAPAGTKPPAPPTTTAAVPKPSPPPKPAPKHWSFDLQAGVDLGFSAADRQLYNTRIRSYYARERLKAMFDHMFTFGKTDGLKSADRMDASQKTDYELQRKLFLYNLGGVGYDRVRRVDLRYEVGPGLGYHMVQKPKLRLNLEVGGNYQNYSYSDDTDSESFFYRIAEDGSWQVTPKLGLDHRFEFFPGLPDMDKFRFRFEVTLRYNLKNNIYLNATVLDQYDNHPAKGISENDLQLRSSIGVKF